MDDTDVIHTGEAGMSGEDLGAAMQQVVDHWEGGLRATGGALRVDKSFWCLIDFKWKNGKWQYCTLQDMPGALTARDASGVRLPLERINHRKAVKQ